jgi:hypothetical protein
MHKGRHVAQPKADINVLLQPVAMDILEYLQWNAQEKMYHNLELSCYYRHISREHAKCIL